MQALLILASALLATAAVARTAEPVWQITERVDVGQVPSGFPVGFSLLTHDKRQYVAYYDAEHRMTIATRTTDRRDWQRHTLDSKVGWDSHNFITMTVDSDDHLHVSGNMHAVPLIYFRTEKAGDITTLQRLPMTGKDE